jgi:dephospho-CoA kinase
MRVIGILGGVASGKSWVAGQLAARGAGVLDADGAGHAVLRLPQIEAAARQRWGAAVFGPDGHIDRRRLAGIVFTPSREGEQERAYLEKLTHPEIGRLLARQAAELTATGRTVAVLDAPLLLEAGWNKLCQMLVYVDAPREVRLARARQRGWSEEDFTVREGAQDSLDWKRARADVIIDNSGPPEHTQAQIERCWPLLVG